MGGIFLDTGQTKQRFNTSFATGPARSGPEMFDLSRQNALFQNLSISRSINLDHAIDDRIDKYEEIFGVRLPHPRNVFIPDAHPGGKFEFRGKTLADVQMDWFEEQITKGRNTLPENQRKSLITLEEMHANIPISARARQKNVNEAWENTSTIGKAAAVAGEMTAFLQDPVILATLPIGWPGLVGRSTLQAMARVGLAEALIAGGSEAIIQPIVQQFREELGFEDAGFEAGLRNVIFATGAGGIFGSSLAGLTKTGQKFLQKMGAINSGDSRTLAAELMSKPNRSKTDVALAGQLEKDANLVEDNPLWPGEPEPKPVADITADKGITEVEITAREQRAESQAEHDARTQAADEVAEDGGVAPILEEPAVPVSGRKITERADNVKSTAELLDPEDLNIDAKRFQFKSATEAEGVTPRLKDVGEWDQTKAGLTLVWEDASGKRFIADGHQRAALAKRLLQETPGADIKLLGIIRKEVDGFTADDVKVEAAMKNIAETDLVTPQMAIDAAKVLRIRPEDIESLLKSLPPRSTLVRTVKGLIQLSDRSFSHVINQKVSATHAALVARLVPDKPNLQDAIMDVLVREQVIRKSDIEAEAIIRQAREVGTRTEVQETLFGKEVLETSLFSERAKVLAKTLQRLRQEKSIFRNLVKNKGQIQEEGNVLKTDVNQQIADESAVAVQLLMKLANRTGALSNALTEAAKTAGQTKKFGPAVDQFIDSIREAITRGDFEGPAVGRTGRPIQTEAQNRTDTQQRTALRDAEELADTFKELNKGDPAITTQGRLFDQEISDAAADPARANEKIPENIEDPNTGNTIPSVTPLKKIAQDIKDGNDFMDGLAGCIRGS